MVYEAMHYVKLLLEVVDRAGTLVNSTRKEAQSGSWYLPEGHA
jgi:hypothetical protein